MNEEDIPMKIGRNDPCYCGSGLKYKKCCMNKEVPPPDKIKEFYLKKYNIRLKDSSEIEGIRRAGKLAIDTLNMVEEIIKPDLKTEEINRLVHDYTVQNGAVPAPLNYRGYPKSVCVSINEVICHGIPGERILQELSLIHI